MTTQKEYLRCCCHFVRYHMTSPSETAVKEYLDHLRLQLGHRLAPRHLLPPATAQ
ncbi:MAG: hypothetical protein INH41_01195, partial [Myxococcaceae bacterium]|nr:hypothetical protein [Myxococcaceae bacterium]